MKAVGVFPRTREVRIVEHPEPSVSAAHEVKLRMLEVGVCGTDRELCSFIYGTPPPGADHFILGHESLAEVIDAGGQVRTLRPGDLVVGAVRKPCADPACTPCRAGHQDFCATRGYRERGIQDMHGFMTEFVVEDEDYLYPVARELRDVAVLVEPLTIAEKSFQAFQAADSRLPWDQPHRTAVVLGAGPVGLLGAMLFRHAGFDTWIYSRARTPNAKAAIAETIGAHYVSSLDTPPREFAAATGNIDVVYEAMGAPQTAFDVLQCLGANGVFVFTGVPAPAENVSIDLHRLLLHMIVKNQVIVGTVNAGPAAFTAATAHLAAFHRQWPRALAQLITHRYPIEGFRDAIFSSGGIKHIIEM
jgi:glucose 1-dehydrogenase